MEVGEPRNRPGTDRWDFFVSYTKSDQAWAEWVAWQLESAGYQVMLQAWDGVAGSNWSAAMDDGLLYAKRTVAILSDAYLASVYRQREWQAAAAADPAGLARKLLPVRVEPCDQPGLLGQVVAVDLFGLAAAPARECLLGAVHASIAGRAKPTSEPAFPGPVAAPIRPQAVRAATSPSFPGGDRRVRLLSPAQPPRSAVSTLIPRFRALLVGVPSYDDDRLPPASGSQRGCRVARPRWLRGRATRQRSHESRRDQGGCAGLSRWRRQRRDSPDVAVQMGVV